VHFLQIWLIPDKAGIAPSYEQKTFSVEDKTNRLRLVASPDAADGSVKLHSDARLYAGVFEAGRTGELALAPGRHAWVHVVRGTATVNDQTVSAGDAVALSGENLVRLEGIDASEILVFDLA
jgi:redox-sensitive bicupin YhaK (pirin superfamily)